MYNTVDIMLHTFWCKYGGKKNRILIPFDENCNSWHMQTTNIHTKDM